ncbi:hypothetical protein V5G24_22120 [Xanthobacter sp. VTT E-85241]|uniref:hypothetical protein n=1 Tax=Roseixanthobacter finlandensis TaxID=3119922 RepID=UPI00372ABD40
MNHIDITKNNIHYITNRILIDGDIEEFRSLKRCKSQSNIYHITLTFNQNRFSSASFYGASYRQRYQNIDNITPILFDLVRGWYVNGLLRHAIPHFNRPNKQKILPKFVCYIDDKSDDSPRPHVHGIMWVPEDKNSRIHQWLTSGNGDFSWYHIEPRGNYHCRPIPDDQIGNVFGYASKYFQKRYSDAPQYLAMKLPN